MTATREIAAPRSSEHDDMALPPGKSCVDCLGFSRCLAFIGPRHINAQATRCDWSPSAFRPRPVDSTPEKDTRIQIGPTDI